MVTSKTIDIHGMTRDQAKKYILREIQRAPISMEKIKVIHGCNNGTVLRDMVREIRNARILEVTPTFSNDGETTIFLRGKKPGF